MTDHRSRPTTHHPRTRRGATRHRAAHRLLALAAALLCLLVPAACGRGDGPGSSADGPLRISTWGNDSRLRLTQQAVDAFTAANPDVQVVVENSEWSAYWDRLATTTAAADAPDVIQMDESYIAAYGARGALLDLDTVGEQLDLSAMEPRVLETGRVAGTLVGAPVGLGNFSVAVNPDVLEQAGVPMPDDTGWTWDELVTTSAAVTDALGDEGVYGLDGFGTGAAELGAWTRQHGQEVWPTDGPGVDQATLTGFFELARRMESTGATPPVSVQVENAAVPLDASLFATGKAAFHLLFHTQISAFGAASGTQLGLLRLPALEAGASPAMVDKASMYWSVSARSGKREQAARLVEFLLTDPAATTVLTTERGIPAIPEVQQEVAPLLDPQAAVALEFSRSIADELVAPPQVTPANASGFSAELTPVATEVLFDRLSPADGAAQVREIIDRMAA